MTASDHLKHRTSSLGGDQIPEDLRNRHEEMYMQATGNFPPEMTGIGPEEAAMLIERIAKAEAALAQKTRECEELAKLLNLHESGVSAVMAAIEGKREAEAQVEQLGRQVAEMSRPVTLEEWQAASLSTAKTFREMASTVLTSRARTK